MNEVYDRFCKRVRDKNYSTGEGAIVDIARRNRFSPALTAKLIVEADLARSSGTGVPPSKSQISPFIRDTNLIEDGTLAYEVLVIFSLKFLTILVTFKPGSKLLRAFASTVHVTWSNLLRSCIQFSLP